MNKVPNMKEVLIRIGYMLRKYYRINAKLLKEMSKADNLKHTGISVINLSMVSKLRRKLKRKNSQEIKLWDFEWDQRTVYRIGFDWDNWTGNRIKFDTDKRTGN